MNGLQRAVQEYLGSPSATSLPQLAVLPRVKPISGPLSLESVQLESGMCQMSEVNTRMSEVALSAQDLRGTSQGVIAAPSVQHMEQDANGNIISQC